MAEEAEKKLKRIMEKLFQSPPPSLGKRRREEIRSEGEKKSRLEKKALPCRPWDRGDLVRRLASFKAMTWFGKPKAIDPVNCARRGWVNVEMDTLVCEACGARIIFSNPSSWTLQQVEKAAAVFSLKLGNGHKLLCPWIDNICEESLAFFPPTPVPTLTQGFEDRLASWRQVSALPVISQAAIVSMNSPPLEVFLTRQATSVFTVDSDIKLTENAESLIGQNRSDADSNTLYNQAHKLLSLCGWEPCPVPYVVNQMADSESRMFGAVSVSAVSRERDDESRDHDHPPSEKNYDPASVVLECKLCGSRIGLWAFTTVRQPLERFNLIESANDPIQVQEPSNQSLILSIAGGPRPEKQHFSPNISLPIVSRNMRTVFETSAQERSQPLSGDQTIQIISENREVEAFLSDGHSNSDATCPDMAVNPDYSLSQSTAKRAGGEIGSSPSKDESGSKFDPIGQHRPFCPWVASSEKNLPGWKLTLFALVKDDSSRSPRPLISSDEQVNDPVTSIRRLFSSPVLKRSS